MMDEDFESLSVSSSDEWAILDDNPANNLVIIDDNSIGLVEKICSICGSELNQLGYKNTYCKICPVCYACHQKYQGHPGLRRCQRHDRQVSSFQESYEIDGCEIHPGNDDCLQSEPIVLDSRSASDFYGLSQSACKESMVKIDTQMYAQNGQPDNTAEKEFPVLHRVQQGFLDVVHATSRPLQIPTSAMHRSIASTTDSSSHRYSLSLSSSDDGEGSSASLEHEHSSTTAAAAPSVVSTSAASDLATKLAAFEFAPTTAVCCAPKQTAPSTLATRRTGCLTGGSPPTGRGLGLISNMTTTCNSVAALRSSPPSPPSASSSVSSSSVVISGSPMNSAAQFFKSVVMHSASTLNNFDFLPMHPWEANQKHQPNTMPTIANSVPNGGSVSPSLLRSTPWGGQQSPSTAVAAESWLPTTTLRVWDEEQFRALVAPKPLPKSVYEASTYNFL